MYTNYMRIKYRVMKSNKAKSEDTEEMPKSRSTAFSKHKKKER